MQQPNKGFTLIEIAIVLTIVGLIIGGVWVAAATVLNNYKTQALNKDVIQVIQNTKRLFAGQGASAVTGTFTRESALLTGIFPPDMISSVSTTAVPIIVTPFSTDQTLNQVSVFSIGPTQLEFLFGNWPQGIPSGACTQLLTTLGSMNNIQHMASSTLPMLVLYIRLT